MGEMLGILLLILIGAAFWHQRRQAELAWQYMRRYCQHHDLQLLSLARSHRALAHQPLRLLTYYEFEFSSDGESHYQGQLRMQGLHIVGVDLPPHRMPSQ
ncbi:hypothetical protein A9R10_02505 [Aeromonas piscicola]|jgi:hypothetical protein|uniref:DUF3301 domain-containing protein n=1 Tax=Aeromonas bestiarum TaxID=105751 RepID=A0AAP4J975_9GAMM|nr:MULTISPECIES: DUF3301 domain-containing protein [Aeromonas]EKP0276658.1 DUF3301 domain-containing protein [Aeromonas bestiarum]KFN20893.1 hypothetical protein JM66_00875 [Aeromonas bestiarum]MCH7346088.1 DUF3301 domain-containing protein [Aeromonas sp. MR7]MCW0504611.1 DUF3301 domain-containing protein [Aeromonas piscicola]MCX7133415.1 DUF3301 domain-containing protein [Aeromonas sp.]